MINISNLFIFKDDVKEEEFKEDRKMASSSGSENKRRKLYDCGISTDEPKQSAAKNKNK